MRKKCLETVFELAKKNKNIVFIGSDLGPGVLDDFKKISKKIFYGGCSRASHNWYGCRFSDAKL